MTLKIISTQGTVTANVWAKCEENPASVCWVNMLTPFIQQATDDFAMKQYYPPQPIRYGGI